ncbi:MAG: FGGY-family carbohydrate kinase [Candidatus Saganbacteria bacterium]|nr:FGGY-family carbohydrate kinase [Candidatus Saganbacteria bacterium]
MPVQKSGVILGVDFGTHGVRVLPIRVSTTPGQSYKCHTTDAWPCSYKTLPSGFKEQDMVKLADAGCKAIKERITTNIDPKEVLAVSTSGWMHGDVLLGSGAGGKLVPIVPASMWDCPRSAPQYESVPKDLFVELTGNQPAVRWTIIKALHRMKVQPDIWDATKYVVTPKDWWNYHLTGELRQERSDMIGAIGVDGKYADGLFKALGMANKFALLVNSTNMVGRIIKEAAQLTGLLEGTPVFAGGGDQQCARIGLGVVEAGVAGFNLGTSGVTTAFTSERKRDPEGLIHFFGDWLMACCMSSGGAFDWLSKITGLDPDELTQAALKVGPGSEGVRVFPWLSGANHPLRDPGLAGQITGLKSTHGRPHIARAFMEAVAIEMVMCADRMRDFGTLITRANLAGGGARDNTGTWPQIFADALCVPVTLNAETEASALGAAMIAAVGLGFYPDFKTAAKHMITWGKTFSPNPMNRDIYQEIKHGYESQFDLPRFNGHLV